MSKARECAKDFIRYYVQRGDDVDDFLHGCHMGHYGADYHAQIGGTITWNGKQKTIANDKIVVTEIQGVPFLDIFPVKQLWAEIQTEIKNKDKPKQMTLF